ncbi:MULTISPECIES: hypothetical protein [unclassified Mesorhizobium]|uniref:hypothetical protein n=1 Tax=unclassified Mesorhizobium TaxID=325217 RepID=UPI0010932E09|nr:MULTISPECIES: hypothetical protein [unclassified Mesorhizobium]TGP85590.1 hypothetical protein EN861_32960 [Mesorhizobium sp. M8A.F.Ca.ET.218.01.1.1]TGT14741.1 hypothetical protein EN856_32500 [Mesorhizobium sp. M8A.F.Ca.ET.213.01.1.1]
MAEELRTGPQALVPANDNGDLASSVAAAKLDRVVLDIARLIGRQLAREAFETGVVVNDNRPGHRKGGGTEPDGKPLGHRREDLPP